MNTKQMKLKGGLLLMSMTAFLQTLSAQETDSTKRLIVYSGSVGITNNGFSIIPTFSLKSPAAIAMFSIRKNRFSFEPDVRLTLDARKGGFLFWFRYRLVENEKFSLRAGVHPAFNLQTRTIVNNGTTTEITQMRRFIAGEIAPDFKITPKWSVGAYYLQGNGLQKDGPRSTHFVTLNTVVSDLKLSKNFRFTVIPSAYYLYMDKFKGTYFTATAELANVKCPFTFQSTINKTIKSDLPGNMDFMWNVTLSYHFKKTLIRIK